MLDRPEFRGKHVTSVRAKLLLEKAVVWWGGMSQEQREMYKEIANQLEQARSAEVERLMLDKSVLKVLSLLSRTGLLVLAATNPETMGFNVDGEEFSG